MTVNAMASGSPLALHDLDPDRVHDEYRRRGLDHASDATLIDAVASVLARPRAEPPNSFVLHAPLELLAWAALVPRCRAS